MATPKDFPSSARMMNKMVAGTKCVLNFFDGVRESGRALRDPKPGQWRRLSQSIDKLSRFDLGDTLISIDVTKNNCSMLQKQ